MYSVFSDYRVALRSKICTAAILLLITFLALPSFGAPLDGRVSTYTQPDGTEITLKFYGDEFYARTETADGYTVVYDPASKTYHYADLAPDGSDFVSTGKKVGKVDPQTLGVNKGLKLKPAARGAKAKQRFEAYDAVVKQRERWEAVKNASREYRTFKKELKKKEKEGKKSFAIPVGTIFPDSEISSSPDMSSPQMAGPEEGPAPAGPQPGPPSFELTGDVVGLTILVDFPDVPGTVVTQAEVDDYCNKPNYTGFGNAGSVFDYFYIQSGSNLRYNNNVTYYVRVPNNKSYYNDTVQDSGICGRLLLNDALDVLIADGYDFSPLTTKSGGNVRACNIFFAGADSGVWSKGLWPHRWVLSPSRSVGDGKVIYDYQITDIGTANDLRIGTFCHENGHMLLGYPDLYSYNGNAANLGYFSLMASGNYGGSGYHPTHIDPYLKTASGWTDIIELDSSSNQRCTVEADGNQFYRYLNPSEPREYFMFEVRDNTGWEGPYGGHGSSVNPAAGLLVWHLREHGSSTYSTIFTADNPNCDYTTPYETLLVEANPSTAKTPWYDDPTPGSDDAFKSSGVSQISDATSPALKFWTASATTNGGGRNIVSGADIHSISADGPTMSFVIGTLPVDPSIVLSRSTIDRSCDFGTTADSATFTIINGGGGTLTYTISTNQTWLSCSPASGDATTETDTITVSFDTAGLAAGSYTATITNSASGVANSPQTITVNLTVNAQPVVATTPTAIEAHGDEGAAGPQETLGIYNAGSGEMTYSVGNTQTWLSLSSSSGSVVSETDPIYLNFDATSLTAGTYYDTVTITSAEASNSPHTVDVTFNVQSPDMIFTYPDGGETFDGSSIETITWASGIGGNVQIDLLKDGSVVNTIVASTPNGGSYDWTVPSGVGGDTFRIRITSIEQGTKTDISNGDFSIVPYLAVFDSFETGLDGWVQDLDDEMNWTRDSAGTPSTDTGPTNGSDGAYYMFTEASGFLNLTANLYKDYDFSAVDQPMMVFDYHMYGTAVGTLNVEVSTDGGTSWDTPEAWSLTGSVGNFWNRNSVDLSAYGGLASVRIRFRGVTGSNWSSDMAIDRVGIADVATDGIRFSSSSFSVAEAAGVVTVTVERVGSTVGAVDVDYATSDGSALNGSDYTATSGTLSWADADGTPKSFTVAILDDSTKETFSETVLLTLSNPTNTAVIGANPATLNIQDDDNQAPTVNAGSDQTLVLAGATWSPLDVGVDLWLDADDAATVQLNGGTVSNWVDKSGFGRDASQTSASSQPTDTTAGLNGKHVLTFDGSSDFFNVDLDFLAGVPHSAFVVTKLVTANNIYGAANGNSGANSLHVGFSGTNYRMNYWANDFGPARSANFQSGAANLVNYVWNTGVGKEIFANGSSEGSNVNAGNIGTMSGGGRISNITGHGYYGGDIAEIIMKTGTVSVVDRELFEGYLAHKWGIESYLPGGHTYATNSPSGAAATNQMTGSASDADDDPLTLTWTMTSGPAPVAFNDDSVSNAVATFSKAGEYTLRLTANDGVDPTFDECVITVITGGVSVVVSESDGSTDVTEGGSTDTYDLSLLIAPTNDVVVDLSTDGQVNVSPTSVTFTAANWTNTHTIIVTAVDDGTDEGGHTGVVSHAVSSLDTAYDGLNVADVIPNITDNDAPGVISLASASYNVSEDGTNLTVYATRTGGDAGAQSVDISTLDGTAVAGTDYTTNSTTLNWSDRNSSSKPFTISILNNSTYAGDRDLSVQLSNITGGASLGTTSATVTIQEDDPEPIGARVLSQSPAAEASQSPGVTQITLTFSEAIDTNSFSLAEDVIAFTGAQGTNLLSTITGHSWANADTELTITFNALNDGASHRLVIGPDILTATGFPMDQDNDSILGEDPEDTYAANIWIVSGGSGITLWSDLVNPDDTALGGWTLGAGWQIGTPAEGVSTDGGTNVVAQSLAGNYTAGSSTFAETPDIDATSFTSLSLDFLEWKGLGKNDIMYVDIAVGGTPTRVYSYTGPNGGANDGAWLSHTIDVSAQTTGQVFRVRWGLEDVTTGGSGVETGWQLDAIELSGDSAAGGDPALPMVVSHAPTGTVEGLVSSLYLSFSQPMDTNSFDVVDDVASFTGPSGAITPTGSVWVSSSLLRIDFAEQVASGLYTLVLEPTLQDTWAQFIDQNTNGTGNEGAADRYAASFTLDNANYIPKPSGLNATAASSSQVDVYWTDNSTNATGFILERSTTSGSGFASIANPSVTNYSDTTVSPGVSYYYRVFATNGTNSSAVSSEAFAAVPKAPATITVSDLAQTYDGSAKPVSIITSPTGLTVNVTYGGNGNAPTNADTYAVYAIISDATYQGETNETLVVSKAAASISFSGLSQTYSGAARTVGASTTPGGLTVDVTYSGSPSAPINAGSYAITGTVNDVNYQGQNTDTLVVSKATPSVTNWPTASDIMDGQALSASSLTGGGATVPGTFGFDAPGTTPGIGTYTADVTFTPTDSTNYESVSGTVDVSVKAAATVTLGALAQTYDGTAKTVTVNTAPTGLVVNVTYAGGPVAPTNAGNYAVEATVSDADYIGSTNGTLVISKATPTVDTWPTAADIYVGQSLADATLSGGSASVTGVVTYDAPGTTPSEGTYSAAVTFTPDDTNNYNTVANSIDVTVLPLPPSAPTGLSAVPGIGEVNISWSASANATSYNVKRSALSGGPYSVVGSPAVTNFTDSVANGATYYYVVSALNAGGESSDSAEVSVTLLHVIPFLENFEGLSVGNLHGQNGWVSSNAVVQTNTALDVQAGSITQEVGFVQQEFAGSSSNVWTDFEIQPVFCAEPPVVEADATAMLYFSTNGNPVVYNGTNLQALSSITLTNGAWIRVSVHSDYANKKWDLFIDGAPAATGLDFYNAAVTRYERLKVIGAGPAGATIDDISIDTESPFGALFIPAPSALNASPASGWQVDLSWSDNSTNETGFVIERSATSGSGFGGIGITGADTTSYSDVTVTPGNTYYYRVMATNALAVSGYSSEASTTPPVPTFTFTVDSLYGTPTPSGVTTHNWNTVVSPAIPDAPVVNGTTQYVATGWTGTGSLDDGIGTNTSFTITNDTTMSWQWTTNYWIDLSTTGE